jgi:hypothetical protein
MSAASAASAQAVYTSVGADGRKAFSDRAEASQELISEPEPAAPRTPAGTMARGSRGAVLVNLNEAQRRLAQAQAKRSQGVEPLAGERTGAGTVSHRYWQRQEKLRLAVEQAQQRLNGVRAPQLARR